MKALPELLGIQYRDDGPSILLPREALAFWEGSDPPSGGRVVDAEFRYDPRLGVATDYDLACDASFEETGRVIEVGPYFGYVPENLGPYLAFLQAGEPIELRIVFQYHLFDEDGTSISAQALWDATSDLPPVTLFGEWNVGPSGEIVAFHAAAPGTALDIAARIDTVVAVSIEPGVYQGRYAERDKDMNVVRWTKKESANA